MPTGDSCLLRQYRVRIALFLALVVLPVFTLDAVYRSVNTLRRLEVVEVERDGWLRPGDVMGALDLGACASPTGARTILVWRPGPPMPP
jgi:hypothetical protein